MLSDDSPPFRFHFAATRGNFSFWQIILPARSDSRKTQGLAAVFIEATPLLAEASVPQFLKDQCATLGLPTQGNAAGNQDPNDLKGLPEGPFPQILGWRPKGIGAMFGCVLSPEPIDKFILTCFMHA